MEIIVKCPVLLSLEDKEKFSRVFSLAVTHKMKTDLENLKFKIDVENSIRKTLQILIDKANDKNA